MWMFQSSTHNLVFWQLGPTLKLPRYTQTFAISFAYKKRLIPLESPKVLEILMSGTGDQDQIILKQKALLVSFSLTKRTRVVRNWGQTSLSAYVSWYHSITTLLWAQFNIGTSDCRGKRKCVHGTREPFTPDHLVPLLANDKQRGSTTIRSTGVEMEEEKLLLR